MTWFLTPLTLMSVLQDMEKVERSGGGGGMGRRKEKWRGGKGRKRRARDRGGEVGRREGGEGERRK